MVSNVLVAAGDAVEQWNASHLYTAIASETLKPDTGCLQDQTCLTVMSVFPVCPVWSGCLGEMRQCFARDLPPAPELSSPKKVSPLGSALQWEDLSLF